MITIFVSDDIFYTYRIFSSFYVGQFVNTRSVVINVLYFFAYTLFYLD